MKPTRAESKGLEGTMVIASRLMKFYGIFGRRLRCCV